MNFKELGANLGLEEEEYRELVDLFVMTSSADYQKLQEALAAKDADMVIRHAHTLKGASGNLGIMDVSITAKRIEERAMDNRLDDLTQHMEILKRQLEEIQAFVAG